MQVRESVSESVVRSRLVDMFRVVVVVLMVSVHVPYTLKLPELATLYGGVSWHSLSLTLAELGFLLRENLMLFLKSGLGRGAVAALTLVSAWFVMEGLERRNAVDVARNRLVSMGLPYVFWAVAYLMIAGGIAGANVNYRWLEKIFGIGIWPYNYPLHFVFDICFATVVFLALHTLGLRNRWMVALAGVALCLVTLLWGENANRFGDNGMSLMPRSSIVLLFFLGVATHGVWKRLFEPSVLRAISSNGVLAGLVLATLLSAHFLEYYNIAVPKDPTARGVLLFALTIPARLICGFLVFAALARVAVSSEAPAQVSRKLGFRIFCSHLIAVTVLLHFIPDGFETGCPLALFVLVYAGCVGFGVAVHYAIEAVSRLRFSPATLLARI